MWSFIIRIITFYIPDKFISGKNKEVKQAFREKYAICFLIFFFSSLIVFLIELLPLMLCSFTDQYSWDDIYQDYHNSLVIVRGKVYNVNNFFGKHPASNSLILDKLGRDITEYFPLIGENCTVEHCHSTDIDSVKSIKFVGSLVWSTQELKDEPNTIWMLIDENFYNTTSYILNNGTHLPDFIYNRQNEDATFLAKDFDLLLLEKYYIGKLDSRFNLICASSNLSFISFAGVVIALTIIKFLVAVSQLAPTTMKTVKEKIIINIPCYSESKKEISKTIESICKSDYDNDNKLLFIVCDGTVKGRGNNETTPQIVLEMLGSTFDPDREYYDYKATHKLNTNFAQTYTGRYKNIPFIVVVKIGNDNSDTGNRGKRDSQVILLDFLNTVSLNKCVLSPLNSALYHDFVNLGINPIDYNFLLTVDADTKLEKDCIGALASNMSLEPKCMGLGADIRIANKTETWVTAIQVYEYFINQNLTKAFESAFGMVTCLSGACSLFRIKNEDGPVLVCDEILEAYRLDQVNTLHLKNLLELGEDRYLTTLLLKTFPEFKTRFNVDAICFTTVPNTFKVLLSQRRRWINSTFHNLFELVKIDLCGCSIFSMKAVVVLDLISTIIMPITTLYLYYLISMVALKYILLPESMIIMISIIYSVQVLIFLFKSEFSHFIWLPIYTVANPIWNIILPLYSFYHMDDFRWGATRRTESGSNSTVISYEEFKRSYKPKKLQKKKYYGEEQLERAYFESV